jgi:hypothetical protein
VTYQESGGGGWTNPLIGRVFDSDRDVTEDELPELASLVERCRFPRSGKLPGRAPADVTSFELHVELDDRTQTIVGDVQRADATVKALVSFIRKHSRKQQLE